MSKKYLTTPEEVVQALQDGKKVYTDFMEYWYNKGVFFSLNKKDGYICINSNISFLHNYMYVEEPEPLKLEVGKFYKTRDGRKALVYGKYKETNEVYPYTVVVVGEPMSEICVSKAGEVVVGAENIEDLVAPWEED